MAINKINSKSIEDLQISADDLANGTVTNAKLANTTITINGTSIDLGSSGDIVAGTDWQAVVVADGSTSTTAVAGEGYFIDTTSNAHTVTLPSSPSIGDTVAIKDYAGTFGTNNLTIGRNGNNIQGAANDSLISTNRASLTLVYVDATKGWLYAVESNVADLENAGYITATGGTITTSGDYKIHTFTGDGCFVVSSLGFNIPCAQASTVDYLVVAGGGSGGGEANNGYGSGGGGAGGFRESRDSTLNSPHTASPLAATTGLTVTATTYPVTVGGGAAQVCAPSRSVGNVGSNSVFSTITSAGGGGGDAGPPAPGTKTGGSGGGAYGGNANNWAGNTPPVSPPQGQPGGQGTQSPYAAGGGGGAGQAGQNGITTPQTGGAGGAGAPTAISGSSTYYAGGGGGGVYRNGPAGDSGPGGSGGVGGGGPGGPGGNHAVAGTSNTGGGGGGASSGFSPCYSYNSGAGGKGIVIIRYKYQ